MREKVVHTTGLIDKNGRLKIFNEISRKKCKLADFFEILGQIV